MNTGWVIILYTTSLSSWILAALLGEKILTITYLHIQVKQSTLKTVLKVPPRMLAKLAWHFTWVSGRMMAGKKCLVVHDLQYLSGGVGFWHLSSAVLLFCFLMQTLSMYIRDFIRHCWLVNFKWFVGKYEWWILILLFLCRNNLNYCTEEMKHPERWELMCTELHTVIYFVWKESSFLSCFNATPHRKVS